MAPDLLGKILVHRESGEPVSGRIVEVEAYCGGDDPGSHAFRGPTPRNRVMFGPAGYLYVYRSYGIHACMNVVCGEPGVAQAVLVRALEPLTGIEIMERRRGGRPPTELCNGPGKLAQALGITLTLNGIDLEGDEVFIEEDGSVPAEVATSTRVGLSRGRNLPWRFFIPGSAFLSPGKPSTDQ